MWAVGRVEPDYEDRTFTLTMFVRHGEEARGREAAVAEIRRQTGVQVAWDDLTVVAHDRIGYADGQEWIISGAVPWIMHGKASSSDPGERIGP